MKSEYLLQHVDLAQKHLGEAFDYAINTCGISGEDFATYLCKSSSAQSFLFGESKYLLGMSGAELTICVLEDVNKSKEDYHLHYCSYSPEFWVGWALAFYLFMYDKSFDDVFKYISYSDILNMYYPLHEADVTKFADIIDSKLNNKI